MPPGSSSIRVTYLGENLALRKGFEQELERRLAGHDSDPASVEPDLPPLLRGGCR